MSRSKKVKLISAYNYYKTMVQFYGLEHCRTKSALVTLITCYRADFKFNVRNEVDRGFRLIKGFESEFDNEETKTMFIK